MTAWSSSAEVGALGYRNTANKGIGLASAEKTALLPVNDDFNASF